MKTKSCWTFTITVSMMTTLTLISWWQSYMKSIAPRIKASPSDKLAAWRAVLLYKLTAPQLVKKFPAFCGTWMCVPVFTRAHHLCMCCARWILSHPISVGFISILSSILDIGLLSDLFPSGFLTIPLYAFVFYPMCTSCPVHLITCDLIIWWISIF